MDTLGAWGRGARVQGIPYQLDQIGDHEKSVMFVPGKVSDSHTIHPGP